MRFLVLVLPINSVMAVDWSKTEAELIRRPEFCELNLLHYQVVPSHTTAPPHRCLPTGRARGRNDERKRNETMNDGPRNGAFQFESSVSFMNEKNFLTSGVLAEHLANQSRVDPSTMPAILLSLGTPLSVPQINSVLWEWISWDPEPRIRFPAAAGQSLVEIPIHSDAAEMLRPLAQSKGTIINGKKTWARDLRTLMMWAQIDLPAVRTKLGIPLSPPQLSIPQPAAKAKRRPVISEPAPTTAAEDSSSKWSGAESEAAPASEEAASNAGDDSDDPQDPAPAFGPSRRGRRPAGDSKFVLKAHYETHRVAALLDVSLKWIKAEIKRGNLTGYRLGTRIVIPAEDLEKLLKNTRMGFR